MYSTFTKWYLMSMISCGMGKLDWSNSTSVIIGPWKKQNCRQQHWKSWKWTIEHHEMNLQYPLRVCNEFAIAMNFQWSFCKLFFLHHKCKINTTRYSMQCFDALSTMLEIDSQHESMRFHSCHLWCRYWNQALSLR